MSSRFCLLNKNKSLDFAACLAQLNSRNNYLVCNRVCLVRLFYWASKAFGFTVFMIFLVQTLNAKKQISYSTSV